jgi:hypothetical protein
MKQIAQSGPAHPVSDLSAWIDLNEQQALSLGRKRPRTTGWRDEMVSLRQYYDIARRAYQGALPEKHELCFGACLQRVCIVWAEAGMQRFTLLNKLFVVCAF